MGLSMTKVYADSLSKTEIEYTSSFIKTWFDKFNQKYFDNKLNNINTNWDNSIDCNGCFVFSIDVFLKEITPLSIKLKPKNISSFDSFRNVLVHEMLHYYVDCFDSDLSDNDWLKAVQIKMTKGEQDKEFLDTLRLSSNKCHEGNWLKLANNLNSKYKELSISAFGDRDIGLSSSDTIDYKNIHLMYVRYVDKEREKTLEKYKGYTKEKYNDVIKHIKEYKNSGKKSKIEYYFYDLEIDRNKLKVSGFSENLGNESFKEDYINYLKSSGVVKKGITLLGKTDNYKSFSVV